MSNIYEPSIQLIKNYQTDLTPLFIDYDTKFEAYTNLLKSKTSTSDEKETAKTELEDIKAQIKSKVTAINNIMTTIGPMEQKNREAVDFNIEKLNDMMDELNIKTTELHEKENEIKNEYQFDGNYEESLIKTTSTFYKNIMFVLLAIFVIGCLIYIYAFPESGKLDMFILGLAIIIVVYYLYDYIVKKNREKAS
jgi:membrane-bound ClpP family serine protease